MTSSLLRPAAPPGTRLPCESTGPDEADRHPTAAAFAWHLRGPALGPCWRIGGLAAQYYTTAQLVASLASVSSILVTTRASDGMAQRPAHTTTIDSFPP